MLLSYPALKGGKPSPFTHDEKWRGIKQDGGAGGRLHTPCLSQNGQVHCVKTCHELGYHCASGVHCASESLAISEAIGVVSGAHLLKGATILVMVAASGKRGRGYPMFPANTHKHRELRTHAVPVSSVLSLTHSHNQLACTHPLSFIPRSNGKPHTHNQTHIVRGIIQDTHTLIFLSPIRSHPLFSCYTTIGQLHTVV